MSTTTAIQIPAGTFALDAAHSDAGFAVKHTVATFRGSFNEVDATLENTDGTAKLTGVVKTDSIHVRQDDLRGHLKSPEFFDVERFPEIRFVSSDLRVAEDGTAAITGELTIRDATKTVEATGTVSEPGVGFDGAVRFGLDLQTTVDRNEFGLTWNAPLPNGKNILGDEVTIAVQLEFVAQEA